MIRGGWWIWYCYGSHCRYKQITKSSNGLLSDQCSQSQGSIWNGWYIGGPSILIILWVKIGTFNWKMQEIGWFAWLVRQRTFSPPHILTNSARSDWEGSPWLLIFSGTCKAEARDSFDIFYNLQCRCSLHWRRRFDMPPFACTTTVTL